MNPTHTENRTLTLALGEGMDVNYVNVAAASIRELTDVRRVRVDLDAGKLEILHSYPAKGLLQSIHSALFVASRELVALRA